MRKMVVFFLLLASSSLYAQMPSHFDGPTDVLNLAIKKLHDNLQRQRYNSDSRQWGDALVLENDQVKDCVFRRIVISPRSEQLGDIIVEQVRFEKCQNHMGTITLTRRGPNIKPTPPENLTAGKFPLPQNGEYWKLELSWLKFALVANYSVNKKTLELYVDDNYHYAAKFTEIETADFFSREADFKSNEPRLEEALRNLRVELPKKPGALVSDAHYYTDQTPINGLSFVQSAVVYPSVTGQLLDVIYRVPELPTYKN